MTSKAAVAPLRSARRTSRLPASSIGRYGSLVDYEVTPEPAGDEREALERALGELLGHDAHPAYVSAWRRAGIAENIESGDGALAK